MKTRGILFKPDLHQAILAGRKTETRRLDLNWAKLRKGDRLYVKEKLIEVGWLDALHRARREGRREGSGEAAYACDSALLVPSTPWRWSRSWLSPLHMPRECARTWLELVEDGRVERLLDIDGDGARREGVVSDGILWRFGGLVQASARDAFLARWDLTHPTSEPNPEVAVLRFRLVTP